MDKDTKILIADENNEVRNHIHERLKVNGAGLIDEVKNGDEAMKMISRQSYDIVISDLWLPSLDAASIMKRTAESGKNTPSFVILTQVSTPPFSWKQTEPARRYVCRSPSTTIHSAIR